LRRARVPLVLDGATGTELEARGIPSGLPLWSTHALLEAPEVVSAIHAAYVEAGADILTANSFRTQRRTLARAGLADRAADLTREAVALARAEADRAAARGSDVWVAGSAPPLEDCYHPELVPAQEACLAEHREHARNLAGAGVDLILVETMNCAREAEAAARAAAETGLSFLVSFIANADARLPSGETLAAALERVSPLEPHAVLVNCLPPSAVPPCLPVLRATGLPFGAYANLGAPTDAGGRSEACEPARFAEHAATWIEAGARIVGGCCGTTPAHIAAVASRVRNMTSASRTSA